MSTLEQPKSGFEYRTGNLVSFLCSLAFHVALLLILACWVYGVGKPSQGLLLSADIGQSSDTALDMISAFELSPPQLEQPPETPPAPEISLSPKLDLVLDRPNESGKSAASFASVSVADVVESLSTQGRGRGANFFGAYAEGNRFVFVLDSSRSMEGNRWAYACNQLLDSLNGLKPGQEFFVICFDFTPSFLFNTFPDQIEFYQNDKNTITRVKNWLRSRTLGRATMPAEALGYALLLNPDAVFLLSDGELQDNSQMMLRIVNSPLSEKRQIPIHTVHLFSLQGRQTLEQIARENGGSFTPVEEQKAFGSFRRR